MRKTFGIFVSSTRRAASLLLSTAKPRSLNPLRLDSGRAVYFRPFVVYFWPFSFRICGKWYVLHANNMLFVLLIQQKASMASPVCGLQGKSHTHPPPLPLSRSLVRSFPKFFLFFFTKSVNGCKLSFYDLVLFMNAVVYGFCCFCRSCFCVLLCVSV